MRQLIVLIFLVLGIFETAQAENIQRRFPPFEFATTDMSGRYTMLTLKRLDHYRVETFVRRTSLKSGELTFTRRVIDCRAMRVQTIAQGDDVSKLVALKPAWVTLVEGSSAHAAAVNGCAAN